VARLECLIVWIDRYLDRHVFPYRSADIVNQGSTPPVNLQSKIFVRHYALISLIMATRLNLKKEETFSIESVVVGTIISKPIEIYHLEQNQSPIISISPKVSLKRHEKL
jgi:hypothetical protein